MMKIEKFLDLGAELETQVSFLYEKIAKLAEDEAMSKQLLKISREELNHANSLKMGKNYLKEAPDIFIGVSLDEEELNLGLQKCRELHDRLQQNLALLPSLKSILDLEKRFEKVHIGVSVSVSDNHLKQLFQALTKGDQNHVAMLTGMISNIER